MYLDKETVSALEKAVGLKYEEILNLSADEEMEYVKSIHPNIDFSKTVDPLRAPRGNPLLARGKILTMKEVEAKFRGK